MTAEARQRSDGPAVHPIVKVLLVQLGLAMALAMLFWGTDGRVAAWSVLLGGIICVIPNAFLALKIVAPRRDPRAGSLLRAAYIGELGKLALSVLLFGAVFSLVRPVAPLPLFTGFIACQLAVLAGFLMRDRNYGTDTDN